jgi:hypothetical protein
MSFASLRGSYNREAYSVVAFVDSDFRMRGQRLPVVQRQLDKRFLLQKNSVYLRKFKSPMTRRLQYVKQPPPNSSWFKE